MMFDRLTERAQLVMQRAKEEAARHGNSHASTEHFLLGLVLESEGIAAMAIRNLGPSLETVRTEVEKLLTHEGLDLRRDDIILSPSGKRAIEYAKQEAQNFGHNYIGTEHILLGVIRESEGIAARVLNNLGINLAKARIEVLRLLGGGASSEVTKQSEKKNINIEDLDTGLPIHITARAWLAVQRARAAAIKNGSKTISSLHLLMGIIDEAEGATVQVIQNLGSNLDAIWEEIVSLLQDGDDAMPFKETPLSVPSVHIIKHAEREAKSLGHNYMDVEHLLLGVLCENLCAAAKVLENEGLTLEKAREEVARLHGRDMNC